MKTGYQIDGSLHTAAAVVEESEYSGRPSASSGDLYDAREGSDSRRKARDAIAAKRLPSVAPTRMWGGPGTGAACVICGEPVRREEISYELEFAGSSSCECHVHIPCFTAWQAERQRNAVAASGASTLLAPPQEGTMAGGERDSPYEQRRS